MARGGDVRQARWLVKVSIDGAIDPRLFAVDPLSALLWRNCGMATKAWKAANPDKVREYRRRYFEKHGARISAEGMAKRRTPEHLAKAAAGIERHRLRCQQLHEEAVARRVALKELAREVRIRAMRVRLPKLLEEKRAAKRRAKHVRRARKRGVGVGLTPGRIKQLRELQKGRCAACRRDGQELTLDHIVPLALGGPHTDTNVQLLCRICNSRKSAKPPEVFMQSMGFLL